MTQSRQLAAIMFTDIQGYTAMMQHDEGLAMKARERHRKIFNQTTEKFNGSIRQYFGDGTLSTFNSAIDAVHCAMEMQVEFQKEPVIPVRIGVHLGDVVIKEDEIIGDGVNVASRIESLAVAGSVFISDKVYDEIKNQSGIEATSLKTFEFKNVDKPIEVFAISNKGMIIPSVDEISGKTRERPAKSKFSKIRNLIIALLLIVIAYFIVQNYILTASPGEEKKSIAVLPFTNMTNDPEQEYFSDGITEDILTHLSRVADLRVISRTSVMQYKNTTKTIPEIGRELRVSHVLEGSVRKYGDQVRITAQLINAETDEHIWADAYDREVTKIFDIQSEVATEILKVLKTKLTVDEQKNLRKSITSEITAYDYYLRGMEALEEGETQVEFHSAARFFEQALEEDPNLASAYVGLAWVQVATREYSGSGSNWADSALALNQIALSLDPDLDEANFLLGIYYFWMERYPEARKQFERVLELNPNHEHAMIQLGETLLIDLEIDEGLDLIIEGWLRHMNHKDPDLYMKLGQIYTEIREYETAKKYFNKVLYLKSNYISAYYMLIEIAYLEYNWQEALSYAQKAVEIERNIFSLDRLAWAYLLLKDYQSAAERWRELGELQADFEDPYFAVAYKHRLGYALLQSGHKEEGMKLIEEQKETSRYIIENQVKKSFAGEAYDLAGIYSFLGNEEEALKWAKTAEKNGFLPVSLIDRDPLFDNLKKNAEFNKLIEDKRKAEEQLPPKLIKAKKKIREMEEKGILTL